MTSDELDAAVTAFRKETEDLIMATVRDIFNIQYGEASLSEGDISISLPTAYISTDDYEVVIFSAHDSDGTEMSDAITSVKTSSSGFTISSPRVGTVRWETMRRLPKFTFWTE